LRTAGGEGGGRGVLCPAKRAQDPPRGGWTARFAGPAGPGAHPERERAAAL